MDLSRNVAQLDGLPDVPSYGYSKGTVMCVPLSVNVTPLGEYCSSNEEYNSAYAVSHHWSSKWPAWSQATSMSYNNQPPYWYD